MYTNGGNEIPRPLSEDQEEYYVQAAFRLDNAEAKRKLIEHNLRLVLYVANRYKHVKTDFEDICSIGTIGLIKAINSYSLEKQTKLSTYAARCIENEILMHLRSLKKSQHDISLNETVNYDAEGNELSVADTVGTDKEEVEKEILSKAEQEILVQILNKLPEEERIIIEKRFGIGCKREKQSELAEHLKISQSYISRIEKKVLKKLKREYVKFVS